MVALKLSSHYLCSILEWAISRQPESRVSCFTPATSGVPKGSILGQILFSILINGLDSGIECTIIKFADDTKLSSADDMVEGRNDIQRHRDSPEELTHVSFVTFNKAKCNKVMHL